MTLYRVHHDRGPVFRGADRHPRRRTRPRTGHPVGALSPLELRRILASDDVAALCLVPESAARLWLGCSSSSQVPDAGRRGRCLRRGGGHHRAPRRNPRGCSRALAELGYGADEIGRVLSTCPPTATPPSCC